MLFGGGAAVAGRVADSASRHRYDTAEVIGGLIRAAVPRLDAGSRRRTPMRSRVPPSRRPSGGAATPTSPPRTWSSG
ncbi:hypothetical protein G5V59_00765 [Nocardioides sp. W3-2-3]|uniref:hypothetical protein n=1 Tax=Nocardioides convexus TaxID=2712224 RepID=UPI0024185308|nr:hypothetical protein [Nocardioides convexus]NGZ99464.1 hypothetical protein [Nocardioides convexus]